MTHNGVELDGGQPGVRSAVVNVPGDQREADGTVGYRSEVGDGGGRRRKGKEMRSRVETWRNKAAGEGG